MREYYLSTLLQQIGKIAFDYNNWINFFGDSISPSPNIIIEHNPQTGWMLPFFLRCTPTSLVNWYSIPHTSQAL